MADYSSPSALALIALMRLKGVGRRSAVKYVEGFETETNLRELHNVLRSRLHSLNIGPSMFEQAWGWSEEQASMAEKTGLRVVSIYDPDYPRRLRNIPDPPAVLFVRGHFKALGVERAIAIVGTREPTDFGVAVAGRSATTSVHEGFAIVSGLAHGCDTFAHEACVEARGTGIAVLAHGVDHIYPAGNRGLAEQLIDHGGCLVSEYPIGAKPFRTFFAERDRIQSGLSDAVLVIETDVVGGTMHTVRFAAAQHRPLACIAHPVNWRSEEKTKGNQQLLREGAARAIADTNDLLAFLAEVSKTDARKTKPQEQLSFRL